MASIKRRSTRAGGSRYDVRLRIGGRAVTKTFTRRQDADRYARIIEADRVRGTAVDPRAGAVALSDYAGRWLDQRRVKGRPLAPRTVELYQDLLHHHVLPVLGGLDIGKLTSETIRSWHAETGRTTTPTVAAKAYRLLHAVLATAEEDGLIGRNPCRIEGAGAEASIERPTVSPRLGARPGRCD